MSLSVKPVAVGLFVLAVAGCATSPADEQQRKPSGDTITGSNIPRRENAPRRETTILTDDAVQDLIKSNGPRGKSGG